MVKFCYSFYVFIGLIFFVEFMRVMWVESVKVCLKRFILFILLEMEIWVKEKLFFGIKLLFILKEVKSCRIKFYIVEIEFGWRVYLNKLFFL